MVQVDILKETPMLNLLSAEQINRLSLHSQIIRLERKQKIFEQKDLTDAVYFVVKGSVKLGSEIQSDKVLLKHIAYKGDIFGENIFCDQYRSEFAQVLKDATLLKIDLDLFKSLLTQNSQFAAKVTEIIIERINALESRMKNFIFMKSYNRIAQFLKEVAVSKGIKIGFDEILINHGLSHKEISFMTDTSRQTVTRVLSELKAENIIHFSARKPNKILIRDLAALG